MPVIISVNEGGVGTRVTGVPEGGRGLPLCSKSPRTVNT